MHDKLKDAFESIHATDDLARHLKQFVHAEVVRRQRKTRPSIRYALACCIMLVITVCGIGSYHFYQAPVSYISVDLNPSVELALNRFDRVVDTTAYNDDGARILQNLNLNNKPYQIAVELLLADKTFASYMSKGALLSFTVVSDKEQALLAGIQQCKGYDQANAECHSANAQLAEEAHSNGLSFGKYQAFLELSQYDSTLTAEDCKDLSMRQIRDLIRSYQGESDASVGGGQGNGHHGGGGGHGGGNGYRGGRGNAAE